jgi:DNA-binding NarL/FixJ family response regulator
VTVRTLLADDHEIVLDGLGAVLEKERGIEVVGNARDGLEAVRAARELQPDVIVMDLTMPGMSGIEAIRRIRQDQPEIKVICLSMHAERTFIAAAFESGAAGYILKEGTKEELVRGIETVMKGQAFVCSRIARTMAEDYAGHPPVTAPPRKMPLTAREGEVLQLIAEGHTTKSIASRLGVSEKTVATHREHIKRKLGIHSTAGLTKYAIRHGLTTIDPHRRN